MYHFSEQFPSKGIWFQREGFKNILNLRNVKVILACYSIYAILLKTLLCDFLKNLTTNEAETSTG